MYNVIVTLKVTLKVTLYELCTDVLKLGSIPK